MSALKYWDGTTWKTAGGGAGDVVGPASVVDNAIARFDGTTGKLIQQSAGVVIDDTPNMMLPNINGSGYYMGGGLCGWVFSTTGNRMFGLSNSAVFINIWGSPSSVGIHRDAVLTWDSAGDPGNMSPDTGIKRNASGVLEINNATAGVYRDLNLRNLIAGGTVSAASGTPWNSPALVAGVTGSGMAASGSLGVILAIGNSEIIIDGFNHQVRYRERDGIMGWSGNTDNFNNVPDTALYRNAAGIVEINNGTAGTYRDLKLRNLILSGGTQIPAASPTGLFLKDDGTFAAGRRWRNVSNSGTPANLQYAPMDGFYAHLRCGGVHG
jgi:hypothetical protein